MFVKIGARQLLQGAAVLLLFIALDSRSTTHAATTEPHLPISRGLVGDFAGKLSPATKRQIETLLVNFRNRTGIEVAVVTIPFADMQGYPIEEYALRLGRKWGVGRDSQKRALLLLVAIKPRNAEGVYGGGTRLEVSRNLEGDIPDILAGELIRKMRDGFVAGRFDQALTTGTQTILATLSQRLAVSMEGIDAGQAVLQPVRRPVTVSAPAPTPWWAWGLIIAFVSIVGLVLIAIWSAGRPSRRRPGASADGVTDSSGFSGDSGSTGNTFGVGWFDGGFGGGGGTDFGESGGGGGTDFGGSGGDFGGGGASDSW